MARFRVDRRCCSSGDTVPSQDAACSTFAVADDSSPRRAALGRFELRRPWLFGASVFFLAAGVFAGSLRAQAVQTPALVVPYQGYLEANGGPASGTSTLVFRLYRTSEDTDELWAESHEVQIVHGRFSVLLGGTTALGNVLNEAGNLYLGIAVAGSGGEPIELEGRQLLGITPFAARGAPGRDFYVDETMVAGAVSAGAAEVESVQAGSAEMGSLVVTGPVQIQDGTEVAGAELVSDADGRATWRRPPLESPVQAMTSGVAYRNETGRRLFVSAISGSSCATNHVIYIDVADVTESGPGPFRLVGYESSGGGCDAFTVTAIVPVGAYYRYRGENNVTVVSATATEL